VVLDQELQLAAEHAALAVQLVRAKHQALGGGLGIGLGDAHPVGDHADLDRVLRVRGAADQRRRQYREPPPHVSSSGKITSCAPSRRDAAPSWSSTIPRASPRSPRTIPFSFLGSWYR